MRWDRKWTYQWHRWFAWHPVKTDDREWVWLEWVERKRLVVYWAYRTINK